MVRLIINQEYMSLQNRMIVKDSSGNEVFLIVGKWGRLGDKMTVYSMNGERLVEAKQTILSLFPKFTLHKDGKYIGAIKKRPGLRGIKKPSIYVSRLNWIVHGDYDKHHFTIKHFTKQIMFIEKTVSSLGDFYILSIENEEYASLACVIAVLLDHYVQKKETLWETYKQEKYSLGFLYPIWMKFKRNRF